MRSGVAGGQLLAGCMQVFSSLVREHAEAAAELDEGTVRDKASLAASRHAGTTGGTTRALDSGRVSVRFSILLVLRCNSLG